MTPTPSRKGRSHFSLFHTVKFRGPGAPSNNFREGSKSNLKIVNRTNFVAHNGCTSYSNARMKFHALTLMKLDYLMISIATGYYFHFVCEMVVYGLPLPNSSVKINNFFFSRCTSYNNIVEPVIYYK